MDTLGRSRSKWVLALIGLTLVAPLRAELLLDAAQTQPDALIAVGGRGTIRRSVDDGQTWQNIGPVPYTTYTGVTFAPDTPAHGWTVGHGGIILATTDAGLTWQQVYQEPEVDTSFLDVLALNTRQIIAVGAFGLYVESSDGGASWTTRTVLEEDMHLNRLSRAEDGTLYLAGEAGTVLRSDDEGRSWAALDPGYDGSFYGVLPLGPADHVLAYGLRGTVYRSTDRGDTWTEIDTNTTALLQTAVRLADGTILLAGQARTLLVSHDEGVTFTPSPAAPDNALAELTVTATGRLLGFGENDAHPIFRP